MTQEFIHLILEYAPGVELQDHIFNLKTKEDKNLDTEIRKNII